MEIKTIWTVGKQPDKDVNDLLKQGWRIANVNVLALPHPKYSYLEANFIVTLTREVAS